jgi:hypothetical protein
MSEKGQRREFSNSKFRLKARLYCRKTQGLAAGRKLAPARSLLRLVAGKSKKSDCRLFAPYFLISANDNRKIGKFFKVPAFCPRPQPFGWALKFLKI